MREGTQNRIEIQEENEEAIIIRCSILVETSMKEDNLIVSSWDRRHKVSAQVLRTIPTKVTHTCYNLRDHWCPASGLSHLDAQ
jgi:hypothetical protein